MKGEGDGQEIEFLLTLSEETHNFLHFYRAMQAYEKALIGGETSLVLSPDSDFFKFLVNQLSQT